MKLNKISMVIAAMAFVGCSSDDFDFSSNKAVDESGMIQLDENFVIAGIGEEDAATRTHWEWDDPIAKTALVNKFLPIYAKAPAAGKYLYKVDPTVPVDDQYADLEAQAVGLCWLGNGAVGTDVYTNYEFYHFGWLNNGATKANVECNVLKNGALYNEITFNAAVAAAAGAEAVPGTDWKPTELPGKAKTAGGADNLNYNSGVYKTDNKSIFGGDYIVYYPYNPDFKDAGTIPAIAETAFSPVSTAFNTKEIGKATFRYSAPVEIKGGDQASDFGLFNLSALVQLRVASPAGSAPAIKTIDKIVLYSAKEQLLKQANLAADKIAAGQKGEALYATKEGTKTITATFAPGVTVEPTNAVAPATTPTSAYITVLPTTVEDLVVLVHATDGKWARVNIGNTVFEAGKAKRIDINVTTTSFENKFYAVDAATLIAARDDARTFVNLDPANNTATVEIIGDITLDKTIADVPFVAATNPGRYNFNTDATADPKITYAGDAIIVPEDVELNIKSEIKSDIRVLGKSCCSGENGGRLQIWGGTVNNVTMFETEGDKTVAANNPITTYSAAATVAAGKTFNVQAGKVVVDAAVKHYGDINIAAGANLTVSGTGDLNFMGGSVFNNGTIEVEKNGKFDMTDADGNATANDGQRMYNNEGAKFIHNVDAGVGTAVQSMHQNGEYRCRVDEQTKLDDAFLQWTACSVIEMVNTVPENYNLGTAESITPAAYKHNGKYIDIEVSRAKATFINPVANVDNKVIQIGNLTVNTGATGLDIDYAVPANMKKVSGVWTGLRTLTVNGNMIVKAATDITTSKQINVTENLLVEGAKLTYAGGYNFMGTPATTEKVLANGGFAVTKNITVNRGDFDASDLDALNIECANFTLNEVWGVPATAEFGNRTEGDAHNMDVYGTINNGAGCTFDIKKANTGAAGAVLAWVTCKQLIAKGNFTFARPRVVAE